MSVEQNKSGSPAYDAVVVGAGPNGLAAAIELAQHERSVLLIEARDSVGGGMRTAELTLPGFHHDICSTSHPLGMASPYLRQLPLAEHGLDWVASPAAVAHPLDDGRAVLLKRGIGETAAQLGADGKAYRALLEPLCANWEDLLADILGPLPLPPRHPLLLARFGWRAVRSAAGLARSQFQETTARALFAGMAAHSVLPLERPVSAAIGLVLGLLGHAVGWPFPRGGAQQLADALAGTFRALGGEIVTGWEVTSLRELPSSRVVLLDVTPRQLLAIVGTELSSRQKRPYQKYRYGPGVFKIDWALSEPIPWWAEACRQAAVVHLGGTLAEIALSEQQVWRDMLPQRPFVLLAQPTLFDDTRAPQGQHTAWAYCHVPHGALIDMTERIENQVERFAPGFRDIILARHTMNPMQMHNYNPNYIGGDINGGVQDIWQLFTRPTLRPSPYKTPVPGVYLCSSSTPPGGGVHGMCGYHAAQAALADLA